MAAVHNETSKITQFNALITKITQIIDERPPFIEIKISNHLDSIISAILLSKVLASKGIPHAIRRREEEQNYPYYPEFEIDIEKNLLNPEIKKYILLLVYFNHNKETREKNEEVISLEEAGFIPPDEISFSLLMYLSFKREFKDPRFKLLAILSTIGSPLFHRNKVEGVFANVINELEELGILEIKKGIIFPCKEGLALHESLSLVLEPQLDGLSLNEESCLDLFIKAGIPTRDGEEWRTPAELDDDELTQLNDKIIEFYSLSKGLRFPKNLLHDQFLDKNRLFACSSLNDMKKLSWSFLHREDVASLFKFLTGDQIPLFKRGKEILKEDLSFYATKVKEIAKNNLELYQGVYGFTYDEIISYENFYALCVFVAETMLSKDKIMIGVSMKPKEHAIVISGSEDLNEQAIRLLEALSVTESTIFRLSKYAWVLHGIQHEGLSVLNQENKSINEIRDKED